MRLKLGAGGFSPAFFLRAVTAAAQDYGVVSKPNVPYVEHDGVKLAGDFYSPKGLDKAPVIIAVHGGGWQGGSPDWQEDGKITSDEWTGPTASTVLSLAFTHDTSFVNDGVGGSNPSCAPPNYMITRSFLCAFLAGQFVERRWGSTGEARRSKSLTLSDAAA
jgi:hypothetical protein